MFLMCVYYPFYKGNEVLEELGFIHNNHLESEDVLQSNVIEVLYDDTRSPLTVMCGNLGRTVTCIFRRLNN
jgi:hypothetical protein